MLRKSKHIFIFFYLISIFPNEIFCSLNVVPMESLLLMAKRMTEMLQLFIGLEPYFNIISTVSWFFPTISVDHWKGPYACFTTDPKIFLSMIAFHFQSFHILCQCRNNGRKHLARSEIQLKLGYQFQVFFPGIAWDFKNLWEFWFPRHTTGWSVEEFQWTK